MNSIIPKAITDLIQKSSDVENEVLEYLRSNYADYLQSNQMQITGVHHQYVNHKYDFVMINWSQNNACGQTPLFTFFVEHLGISRMRQYRLNSINTEVSDGVEEVISHCLNSAGIISSELYEHLDSKYWHCLKTQGVEMIEVLVGGVEFTGSSMTHTITIEIKYYHDKRYKTCYIHEFMDLFLSPEQLRVYRINKILE